MRRVLILGGGFGGIAAAHKLRQGLSAQDEIVLVDRRNYFMVGFRKTWALTGASTLEAGQRPLSELARFGIQYVQGSIQAIDPAGHAAEVDGRRLEADALLIALGAELAPEAVPGFQDSVYNVYDPQSIPRAAEAVRSFAGGRLGLGIFGAPYKCPPAPYEMALLLRSQLAARRVKATLEVFSPQPMSMPILGEAGCSVIDARLEQNDITFLPSHKAVSVEAGEVVFANGKRRRYDLLLGVPPHRCPAPVKQAGLTGESGWVTVDAGTLATGVAGVYAVGDVVEILMANGKPLPKAGAFAEAMGQVAAEHILAGFNGQESPARFAGVGGCFLEVGPDEAVMVRGEFLAQPAPIVTLTEASHALLEEKRTFETTRLQAWFA